MNRSDGLRQRRRAGSDDGDSAGKSARKPRITLESFDLYTKVRPDEAEDVHQVQTTSGATVTLLSLLVCLVLVSSEVYRYVVPKRKEHMVVDPGLEGRLRINFDVTFPSLPCADANLDAMDVAGEQQNGIDHDMQKVRLAPDGTQIGDAYAHVIGGNATEEADPLPADYCGPCFGAESHEGQCCNSCHDVREAYAARGWNVHDISQSAEQCLREKKSNTQLSQPGEGCRLGGHMMVNKVAGNFHIAMGETHTRGAGHIHQFNPQLISSYNVSHIIHTLSFGEPYPGITNPLDGTTSMVTDGTGVFMYFAKVIPTIYNPGKGENLTTNQYSITSQFRPAIVNGMRQNVLPGLFFVYDISPFQVTVTEHTSSLTELVTSLCAILGGIITAAKVLDATLHSLQRKLGVKDMVSFMALMGDGHNATAARVSGGGGAGGRPSPQAAFGGGGGGGSGLGGGGPGSAGGYSPAMPISSSSPAAAYNAGGGFSPAAAYNGGGGGGGGYSPYGGGGPGAMPHGSS